MFEYDFVRARDLLPGVDTTIKATMNAYARKGWRVVSVLPDTDAGRGVCITFEREIKERGSTVHG